MAALAFACVFSSPLSSLDAREAGAEPPVPVSALFYRVGNNLLESFTCDYGAWYAAAAFSTWLMVESGLDWRWRNIPYRHQTAASVSLSAEIAGYAVPVGFPAAAYFAGRVWGDETLQRAALASLQAVGIAEVYHVLLKLATGRKAPGISDGLTNRRSDEAGDFSGDFSFFTGKRGFVDGWPSGHTAAVVAMSVSFAQVYRDSPRVKIALYSFSALMGLGMSFNSHWASDVLAGALMGYAAGKTVGRAFGAPRPDTPAGPPAVTPYLLPAADGLTAGLWLRL